MNTTKLPYSSFAEAKIENRHQTTSSNHCVLTPTTTAAIAMLHSIASGQLYTPNLPVSNAIIKKILPMLMAADIIRSVPKAETERLLAGYELTRSIQEISLLEILKAIDQQLDCHNETNEELYDRYRQAASNLGIINHMTRLYLSKIKLSDL